MPSNPVLVVTNPLHYTYFRQQHPIATIGSVKGLVAENASALGMDAGLKLYDAANTVEALAEAHHEDGNWDVSYIAWKPVSSPYNFLGNSYELAQQLEKKAQIRAIFPDGLFPEYKIIPPEEVSGLTYGELARQLDSDRVVLQIDFSTGGKGTFFVDNAEQLEGVRSRLADSRQDIVASRRIAGRSYGLQGFIGGGSVFSLPWWHQDLVGVEGICNPAIPEATKYCGAVLENVPETYKGQVEGLMSEVGNRLQSLGYYGIFGVDIVVDTADEKVHLIEVNPRVTAVSHLYATAMRPAGYATDFLTVWAEGLLDMVSWSQFSSQMERRYSLPADYFYFKTQNMSAGSAVLADVCRLGVYGRDNTYLRFGFGIDALHDADELIVIPEASHGLSRKPGERTFSLIGQGNPLAAGRLDPDFADRLEDLHKRFIVRV